MPGHQNQGDAGREPGTSPGFTLLISVILQEAVSTSPHDFPQTACAAHDTLASAV